MCAQPICQGERLWKCFDCSKDQEVICFCTACFKQGKHFGHRIYVYHKKSDEASCDCGDISQPYIITCTAHKGADDQFQIKDEQLNQNNNNMIQESGQKDQCKQEEKQQDILQAIPVFLRKRIEDFIFKEVFSKIFVQLESDSPFQILEANEMLFEVLELLDKLITEGYQPMVVVVSNLLSLIKTEHQTNHGCDNIQAEQEVLKLLMYQTQQQQQQNQEDNEEQMKNIIQNQQQQLSQSIPQQQFNANNINSNNQQLSLASNINQNNDLNDSSDYEMEYEDMEEIEEEIGEIVNQIQQQNSINNETSNSNKNPIQNQESNLCVVDKQQDIQNDDSNLFKKDQKIQQEEEEEQQKNRSHTCNCTVLENLFRVRWRLEERNETKASQLLIKLMSNVAYKERLVQAYGKMFQYLFQNEKLNFTSGGFYSIYAQFFSFNIIEIIQNNKKCIMMENLNSMFSQLIQSLNSEQSLDGNNNEDDEMYKQSQTVEKIEEIWNVITYIIQHPKNPEIWQNYPAFPVIIIQALCNSTMHRFFSYQQEKTHIQQDFYTSHLIDYIYNQICKMEKGPGLNNLLRLIFKCLIRDCRKKVKNFRNLVINKQSEKQPDQQQKVQNTLNQQINNQQKISQNNNNEDLSSNDYEFNSSNSISDDNNVEEDENSAYANCTGYRLWFNMSQRILGLFLGLLQLDYSNEDLLQLQQKTQIGNEENKEEEKIIDKQQKEEKFFNKNSDSNLRQSNLINFLANASELRADEVEDVLAGCVEILSACFQFVKTKEMNISQQDKIARMMHIQSGDADIIFCYKYGNISLFDRDFAALQMLCISLKPDQFLHAVLKGMGLLNCVQLQQKQIIQQKQQSIIENEDKGTTFIKDNQQQQQQQPQIKQKTQIQTTNQLKSQDDLFPYFELLSMLVTNELSMMACFFQESAKNKKFQQGWCETAMKNLLLHSFCTRSQQSFQILIQALKDCGFNDGLNQLVKEEVVKYVNVNKETKQLSLMKEYEKLKLHEPYFFKRNESNNSNFYFKLIEQEQQEQKNNQKIKEFKSQQSSEIEEEKEKQEQYYDLVMGNSAELYAEEGEKNFCNLIAAQLCQSGENENPENSCIGGIVRQILTICANIEQFSKFPKILRNVLKLFHAILARGSKESSQPIIQLLLQNNENYKLIQQLFDGENAALIVKADSDLKNGVKRIQRLFQQISKQYYQQYQNYNSQQQQQQFEILHESDKLLQQQDITEKLKKEKQMQKQMQIMQQFKMKQQQFVQQNVNNDDIKQSQSNISNQEQQQQNKMDIEQNNKNISSSNYNNNSALLCQVCKNTKQQQQQQNQFLVLPVYLNIDNLHQYYHLKEDNEEKITFDNYNYCEKSSNGDQVSQKLQPQEQLQEQSNQNIYQKQESEEDSIRMTMLEEQDIDEQSSLRNNLNIRYSLTTCKHLWHFECGEFSKNKNYPQQIINSDEHQNLVENFCPLCSRLSNLHLLYLEPFFPQEKLLNKLLQYQINKQSNQIEQQQLITDNNNNFGKNNCDLQNFVLKLNELIKQSIEKYSNNNINNTVNTDNQKVKKQHLGVIPDLENQLFEYLTIFSLCTKNENNFDLKYVFGVQEKAIHFLLDQCFMFGFAEFCSSGGLTILRNLYLSNKALLRQQLLYEQTENSPNLAEKLLNWAQEKFNQKISQFFQQQKIQQKQENIFQIQSSEVQMSMKQFLVKKIKGNSFTLDEVFSELAAILLVVVQLAYDDDIVDNNNDLKNEDKIEDEDKLSNLCFEVLIEIARMYFSQLSIIFAFLLYHKKVLISQQEDDNNAEKFSLLQNDKLIKVTPEMLLDYFFFKQHQEPHQQTNSQQFHKKEHSFSLLQGYLLPYYRLIAGFFAGTVFRISEQQQEQLTGHFNNQNEELSALINVFGPRIFAELEPTTLNRYSYLIEELNELMQIENEQNLQQFEKQIQVNIHQQQQYNNINNEVMNFIDKNPCQKFNSLQLFLKQDVMKMHEKFFFKMCQKCKDYPKVYGSDLCVCLICGDILCSIACEEEVQQNKKIKKRQKNLFDHARIKHLGDTIFFVIQRAEIFLVSSGKAIYWPQKLYNDKVGQEFVNKPNINWFDYTLSKNEFLQLQNDVIRRLLPIKIRNILFQYYRNNEKIIYYSEQINSL